MAKKKKPQIRLPKIELLPSGQYHTRVLIEGRRVSITKDTEQECVAEYLALKHRVMEAQENTKRRNKSLEDAIDDYIKAREGKRSPSTIYGYKSLKQSTFQSMMKANVFTATDAQWQAAINTERKLGRSSKYIKNAWALVSASIEAATGRRPDIMLFQNEPNERQWLDHEQINTFVEAVKGQKVEIAALLCLSSLRRSEVLALKWDKVDLKKKVIYVHGARVRSENGMTEKKQNKTDRSRRTIPIIPPLLEALEAAPHTSEYVVTMSPTVILRHVNRVCDEAGLPRVGLHGLRHSFASLAYHLEIPEMVAAQIGGWKDLGTMHKIYTHIAETDIVKRSQDFSNYFASPVPPSPVSNDPSIAKDHT